MIKNQRYRASVTWELNAFRGYPDCSRSEEEFLATVKKFILDTAPFGQRTIAAFSFKIIVPHDDH